MVYRRNRYLYLRFGSDEGAREDPAIYGGDEVPPASSCTTHVSR